MSKVSVLFTVLLAGVLAACSSGPLRSFSTGDELAVYDFSEPRTFEEGAYPDATLRIVSDSYRITLNQGDSEIWWSQWGDTLSDVVIDVDVEQISEPPETAYGVACRMRGQVGQDVGVDPALAAIASSDEAEATAEATAEMTAEATDEATEEATQEVTEEAVDEATEEATQEATEEATDEATKEATEEATDEATEEATQEATAEATSEVDEAEIANGDGYLFLIQGTGNYAILRSRGRSLTPLVNWTQTDKIKTGPDRNQLRAVCVGDYLAFYINGEFVADATDTTYSSGQVGLAASASNRLGVQVEFDNLVVHEATAG